MDNQNKITEFEQIIINLIKSSDHDDDGIKFEYESNFIAYSKFTFSELFNIINSLLLKNAIKIKYDHWNNKVYMIK